jgi:hypothetical protein
MIFLQSESKEENPKGPDQQNPSEPPILSPTKETVDEHANSHGESPSKVKGDGVEEDTTGKNEETKDRSGPETRSLHTEDLPLDSANSQPKPSASAKSNQASSTQELTHDSESMPEAEVGGPDILSVSSTSKLSASLGVQEEEFANMHKSDPAGTLRLLLSKKQSQATTSSERTPSDSNLSNAEINSMVRQDSLLLKLTTTFVNKDVLKQIEENPACAYSHLAFLKKLHNPLTKEETLGKVIQLGSIVDQYAKAVQKRLDNDTRLATQQQAQAMFFEKAQKAQAEVDKLSSQANEGDPRIENSDKNIAFYQQQIGFLEDQIKGYKHKISEEQTLKAQIQEEMKASTQEMIDAKGMEGIQAFSAAEVVAEEIKSLESSNLLVEGELATLKRIYADCTKDL